MTALRKIGRIVFINILILAGLLAGFEIFLQVGSYVSKTIDWASSEGWYESRQILDDEVIVKGNPKHPEHDSRGMRNPRIPDRAFMVTLGDSHTYGSGVARPYPWPRQLETMTGRSVYNFSFGGWGTVDAFSYLDEAIALKPSFVIFGAYYGNDLLDDIQSVQHHDILHKFASPSEIAEIERLEQKNNISKEIGFLYRRGREPEPEKDDDDDDEQPEIFVSILRLSKTFVLLENIKDQILTKDVTTTPFILSKQHELSVGKLTPRQREYVSVFNNGEWKTVLTARYRNRTMLPEDLRIRVAARIQQETIIDAAKTLADKGIRLIVVFMPTKENVFWPKVKDPEKHPYLSDLVENEKHFKSALKRRLDQHGIGYVDPLEQMRRSEVQPYYGDGDGHPNQFGHRIVAEQLIQYMTEKNWLKKRDGKYVAARTSP